MRALGVDFGERRIGLALSDPDGRLALPLRVLERRSDEVPTRAFGGRPPSVVPGGRSSRMRCAASITP